MKKLGISASRLAAAALASLLLATPASANPCAGVIVFGPAEGQRSAPVMTMSQTPAGTLTELVQGVRVIDCEGDLYVIPWNGAEVLVRKRDVRTNIEARLPVCAKGAVNRAANEHDRSSQGWGGGCREN